MLVVLSPAPLISEAITNGKRIFNVIAWEFSFDISNTSSLEKKNFVKSECCKKWIFSVKMYFFPRFSSLCIIGVFNCLTMLEEMFQTVFYKFIEFGAIAQNQPIGHRS